MELKVSAALENGKIRSRRQAGVLYPGDKEIAHRLETELYRNRVCVYVEN